MSYSSNWHKCLHTHLLTNKNINHINQRSPYSKFDNWRMSTLTGLTYLRFWLSLWIIKHGVMEVNALCWSQHIMSSDLQYKDAPKRNQCKVNLTNSSSTYGFGWATIVWQTLWLQWYFLQRKTIITIANNFVQYERENPFVN